MVQVYTPEEKDYAKQNNISKSYARKVLAGEFTIEQVREKIRLQNQPVKNKGLKYVLKHLKAQTPFVFSLYGSEVAGTIKKVRKYDIHVVERNGKTVRRVKKLNTKFFYKAEFADELLDLMKIKPVLQQENLQPVLNREERYQVDKQLLETALEQKKPIKITLRSGEIFKGTIRWSSDFESKLQLDDKVAVIFFHHALHDVVVV